MKTATWQTFAACVAVLLALCASVEALPVVSVSVSTPVVLESSGDFVLINFNLDAVAESTFVLYFDFEGTATENDDYTVDLQRPPTGPFSTFVSQGSFSAQTAIIPKDDLVADDGETIIVFLVADAAYDIGSPSSASILIAESLPVITATFSPASISEGAISTLTFTRSGSDSAALDFDITIESSATYGVDFTTTLSNGRSTITFEAGQGVLTFPINALNDNSVESDEFILITIVRSDTFENGSPNGATVTITDVPPSALPTITASFFPNSIAEGSTSYVSFTRSGPTTSAISFDITLESSATYDVDFTTSLSNGRSTITLDVGVRSTSILFTALTDDAIETDEFVLITIVRSDTYQNGSPNGATVTITDVPPVVLPTITATFSPTSIAEGAISTLTFTRSGSDSAALDFDVTIESSATYGIDFTTDLSNGRSTLRFPAGAGALIFTFDALTDDAIETDEFVLITIVRSDTYQNGSPNGATLTITDVAPVALPTITATFSPASIAEGSSSTLTFTRSGSDSAALDFDITIESSATYGIDFSTTLSNGRSTITFEAGQGVLTFPINALNDNSVESDEFVLITIVRSDFYENGSPNGATLTITDVPPVVLPTITATFSPISVAEGSSSFLTFTRSGSDSAALDFDITIESSATYGVDFSVSGISNGRSTLRFPAGQGVLIFTFNALNDNAVEGDEFVLITVVRSDTYENGSPNGATLTITDVPPVSSLPTITASFSPISVAEGSSSFLSFSRGESVSGPLDFDITIESSATYGVDFSVSGISNGRSTLRFAAGVGALSFTFDALTDNAVEGDEFILITIVRSQSYENGSHNGATLTITDVAPVRLPVVSASFSPSIVAEKDDPSFLTFTRTGSLDSSLTVDFTITGSATPVQDYTSSLDLAAPRAIFAPGSAQIVYLFTPVFDDLREGTETVVVTINSESSQYQAAEAPVILRIADTLIPSITLQVSGPAKAVEGSGAISFDFVRTEPFTDELEVFFEISGTAALDKDYIVSGAFANHDGRSSVTFRRGSEKATVVIRTLSDPIAESEESIIFTIVPTDQQSFQYTVGFPFVASGFITDVPPVSTILSLLLTGSGQIQAGDSRTITVSRTGILTTSVTALIDIESPINSEAFLVSGGADLDDHTISIEIPAGSTSESFEFSLDFIPFGVLPVTFTLLPNGYTIDPTGSSLTLAASNDLTLPITFYATNVTPGTPAFNFQVPTTEVPPGSSPNYTFNFDISSNGLDYKEDYDLIGKDGVVDVKPTNENKRATNTQFAVTIDLSVGPSLNWLYVVEVVNLLPYSSNSFQISASIDGSAPVTTQVFKEEPLAPLPTNPPIPIDSLRTKASPASPVSPVSPVSPSTFDRVSTFLPVQDGSASSLVPSFVALFSIVVASLFLSMM